MPCPHFCLRGQLLPAEAADWTTGAGTAGAGTASASAAGGEVQRYLRYKASEPVGLLVGVELGGRTMPGRATNKRRKSMM